ETPMQPQPAADPLAAAAPTLGVNLSPTPTPTGGEKPSPTARTAPTPSVRPERSAAKSKGELARAPKGKPAVVAAARHGYTIQVASVAHRVDAEKVARRYQARHPRVVAADVPGKGRVWRVQVGSYPTRDAASRSLAALGAHGYITAMR
ncbi:MAG: SPOR domain-containing protein, partial [Anaeromyxobacteraceae bacterium]